MQVHRPQELIRATKSILTASEEVVISAGYGNEKRCRQSQQKIQWLLRLKCAAHDHTLTTPPSCDSGSEDHLLQEVKYSLIDITVMEVEGTSTDQSIRANFILTWLVTQGGGTA